MYLKAYDGNRCSQKYNFNLLFFYDYGLHESYHVLMSIECSAYKLSFSMSLK